MWAVGMIVDEKFQHLMDLLPSRCEPHGFIHQDEEHVLNDIELDDIGDDGANDELSDGPNDRAQVVKNDV
jgi:hypothetical protein